MAVLPTAYGPSSGWIVKTIAGAAVTTVTVSASDGLPDGDSAIAYAVFGSIAFNSASNFLMLRPNSSNTNQRTVGIFSVNGGAATPTNSSAGIGLCVTRAVGFAVSFSGILASKRGTGTRQYEGSASEANSAGNLTANLYCGQADDDAALWTSLDFTHLTANGIGIGSYIAVRPLVGR